MRVAIIVGHDRIAPGAVALLGEVGPDGTRRGATEYAANLELAAQLNKLLVLRGVTGGVFYHVPRGANRVPTSDRATRSYFGSVLPTLESVNDWAPDFAVELHFNSVPQHNEAGVPLRGWSGAFCLHHPGSAQGEGLGRALSAAAAASLQLPDLGSLPRAVSWSGVELLPLTRLRCPSVLLESHNGRNPQDHAAFQHALLTGELASRISTALSSLESP